MQDLRRAHLPVQGLHSCSRRFLVKLAQGGPAIGKILSNILDAVVCKGAVWLGAYDTECDAKGKSFVDLATSVIFSPFETFESTSIR